MSFFKTALALASAALLASCGGGASTADQQAQAFATGLKRSAQAAGTPRDQSSGAAGITGAAAAAVSATSLPTAVTAEAAAEQLMNFGEAQAAFKLYFPSAATTQTLAPFRYRYYAASGVYLGVVVQADMGYTLYGVYVMGGPFGANPVYVGQLTDFITPVPPDTGPVGGSSNGCYDMSIAETQGTRHQVTYTSVAAGTTSTLHYDDMIGAVVTFEGQQRREAALKITGAVVAGMPMETEVRRYFLKTGAAEITNYGTTTTTESTTAIGGSSIHTKNVSKTVFTPPWVDKQYALAPGESLTKTTTQASTGTTTTTTTITGLPPTTNTQTSSNTSTSTDTIRYVGRESVTVPAGRYDTCRYEQVNAVSPNVKTTTWSIVGKGIMVKLETSDGTLSFTATSVKFNGQPL